MKKGACKQHVKTKEMKKGSLKGSPQQTCKNTVNEKGSL